MKRAILSLLLYVVVLAIPACGGDGPRPQPVAPSEAENQKAAEMMQQRDKGGQ